MRKIITFTANMLAETTYYVSSWEPGKVSRATDERFQVGGKGINVTKMLQRLGASSTAICFPGGEFGPSCETWLKSKGIDFKAFTEDCITRSGSIIRPYGEEEYSVLGLDSVVSVQSLQSCIDFLDSQTDEFVFAVCGSIPEWESRTWDGFREWLSTRSENVKLAIDTYGPPLKWLADQAPSVVKINRQELNSLFEEEAPVSELLDRASRQYSRSTWMITDGSESVWFCSRNEPPQSIEPPAVDCISPVGCGDVFFATLLDCMYSQDGYELKPSVIKAADYASRSAASHGVADFSL